MELRLYHNSLWESCKLHTFHIILLLYTGRVYVKATRPTTRPCTRPCMYAARVHGHVDRTRTRPRARLVYGRLHVPFPVMYGPCTRVDDRVRGHVYLRHVYTAVYITRTGPYARLVHGRLYGPCPRRAGAV